MNKEQKAAVIDEVAAQIRDSEAVFAVDYRGLSVTQAVELRTRLGDAGAGFRVVKNRLTSRAADKAGAESLKGLLQGPTAFAFVRGDAALAAKAIATFRREQGLLAFKGGTLEGEPLTIEQLESIAQLPAREELQGQFVGVLASPITGLARGLGSMVQGLVLQLGQIRDRGLVAGGESAAAGPDGGGTGRTADGDGEPSAEGRAAEPSEAPGDPVAEAEEAGRAADAEDEAPQGKDQQETSGEGDGEGAEPASDDETDASDGAEAKED